MKKWLLAICAICAIGVALCRPASATTPTPQITPSSPLYSAGRAVNILTPPGMQTASAAGAAGVAISLSVPSLTGMRTLLYGFDLTCAAPSAAETGTLTVTGIAGQTLTYEVVETAAAGANLDRHFAPLPAAAAGNITLSLSAVTSGAACALNVEYGFTD